MISLSSAKQSRLHYDLLGENWIKKFRKNLVEKYLLCRNAIQTESKNR